MFAPISPIAGVSPFNDYFVPTTEQTEALGLVVPALDSHWGYGEFMYIRSNDAITKGALVEIGVYPTFNGTLLPNTANLGRPFGVAMNNMASGTFGWIQISGMVIYKTNSVLVADGAVGIGAAGIVGANTAGKQLLGVRNLRPSNAVITVPASTVNQSYVLKTTGYDGFFVGQALSGTGIPANTVAAKLSEDGSTIYMGSAIGVVGDRLATATGGITLSGTFTNYGAGFISRPFAQGVIT